MTRQNLRAIVRRAAAWAILGWAAAELSLAPR